MSEVFPEACCSMLVLFPANQRHGVHLGDEGAVHQQRSQIVSPRLYLELGLLSPHVYRGSRAWTGTSSMRHCDRGSPPARQARMRGGGPSSRLRIGWRRER